MSKIKSNSSQTKPDNSNPNNSKKDYERIVAEMKDEIKLYYKQDREIAREWRPAEATLTKD